MHTATNRTPVLVYYPPTEQYLVVKRGDEFENNHPLVKDKNNAYLFEEDQGEGARVYSSEPVEQATQAPGERRNTRKPGRPQKADGEPVEPKKDEGSGNGPIRSDSI